MPRDGSQREDVTTVRNLRKARKILLSQSDRDQRTISSCLLAGMANAGMVSDRATTPNRIGDLLGVPERDAEILISAAPVKAKLRLIDSALNIRSPGERFRAMIASWFS